MTRVRHSGSSRNPVTDHLDLWTSALLVKSTAGRGGNGRLEAYGIKKLRQLILELAMCGKLLPRLTGVESATLLLEKIVKEKARLVTQGVLKKEKPLPEITDAEKTCELPQEWVWARFGSIARHNSGKTLDRGRNAGELRDYITTSNLYWGRFDLSNVRQMPIAEDELERCTARKGDLLICEGGESGRAAVWDYDKEVCFQNHVHRARFFGDIDPYFVYRFFEKLNATGEIEQHRKGVGISNMSSKALASIVVPLPPLAEQRRIVAKVDELMALCDQLEQQQGRGIEAHQTLVETLLGTLTRVESAQEFAAAWNRISEHFDTLFTTEHSIDQLKQTILQLAVMGKLVTQIPGDEPAYSLLKKIENEKAKLISEGKMRTERPLPPVGVDEQLFSIPKSWAWVRLGAVLKKITDGTHHSPPNGDVGEFLYISAKNIKNEGVMLSNATYVSKKVHDDIYSRCDPELGDVLFIKDGATTGIAAINNLKQPFSMLSSVALLKCPEGLLNKYLLLSLRSPYFYSEMRAGMTGVAITRVTLKKLGDALITLPPFAEQGRIVAKVDELMALCDALKARLAEAQATQISLADAIVERAVAAPETVSA